MENQKRNSIRPREWVRFHKCSLSNLKVGRLSDAEYRAWSNCLLIADGKTGELPGIEDLAWHLRKDVGEALELIEKLIAVKLIDKNNNGILTMHDWEEHQRGGRPSAEDWALIRRRIFERDNYTCQYCGAKGVKLQCDHIFPVKHGGTHEDENLVTACEPCNRAKGGKVVAFDEWKQIRGGGA